MCGITGYIDYGELAGGEVLDRMTDALAHRGPDDRGTEVMEEGGYSVGFGHRRLSIIDLSPLGHQPMHYRELSIVFNGEIYNYEAVRKELEEGYGRRFKSHSDTEVILQAYYQWGIKCVDRLNGMFALALYDGRSRELYLLRDRAGVKPLYYYSREGLFLFGSELKSFHQHPGFKKELDRSSLGLFLQYGYVPAPYSIFRQTRKVKPGHYLVYELEKRQYREEPYWDVYDYYNKPRLKISYEDALEELDGLLQSAFNYRMVSDVPVGVFLSGGYDSSTVTAVLQKQRTERIKTFTIGFREDKYNEAEYAKKVAEYLDTDHTEYYCTEQEALKIIPDLPYYYDEPFGDASAIPTTLVSRLARQQVTVALSADGGDEAFAGYTRYHNMQVNLDRINKIPRVFHKPASGLISALNKLPVFSSPQRTWALLADLLQQEVSGPSYNKYALKRISDKRLNALTGSTSIYNNTAFDSGILLNGENDDLSKVMAIDYKTYLVDDILVKVDRATMSVSLEGREPLLDYRIIELAAQLPTEYKYRNGVKKRMLRDIAYRYLPKELLDRPKMGFGIPLAKWLRNELKSQLQYYLEEKHLLQQGIFKVNLVGSIKNNFLAGHDDDAELLWFILMFQMWYDRWHLQ